MANLTYGPDPEGVWRVHRMGSSQPLGVGFEGPWAERRCKTYAEDLAQGGLVVRTRYHEKARNGAPAVWVGPRDLDEAHAALRALGLGEPTSIEVEWRSEGQACSLHWDLGDRCAFWIVVTREGVDWRALMMGEHSEGDLTNAAIPYIKTFIAGR